MHKMTFLGVATLALGVSTYATADILQFDVVLDATQISTGSLGTGTATALFNNITGDVSIAGSFADLTGTSSMAHLHGFTPSAGTGGGAGVLLSLAIDAGVAAGNFSGAGIISMASDPGFAKMLGGQSYINIHSSTSPGGEIRGQLVNPVVVPEPGSIALVSLAGLALLRRRR